MGSAQKIRNRRLCEIKFFFKEPSSWAKASGKRVLPVGGAEPESKDLAGFRRREVFPARVRFLDEGDLLGPPPAFELFLLAMALSMS
jgi:hypothetical protein